MFRVKTSFFIPLTAFLMIISLSCHRRAALGLGLDTMYRAEDTAVSPTVRLETAVLPPLKLLCISFEVFKVEDIGRSLNAGYVELCNYINKHKLPAGRVMAFYYTYDMPYVLEAAIEVDSIPAEPDSIITARVMAAGNVLIAHYKGPYEKAAIAYHAIDKWLTDNRKVARDLPFEVYLNDPLTTRNKNKLLTDIYQYYK